MTQKEQVENMIGVMSASNNPFVDVPIEIMPQVAEALYNAGYRKVPENAVVLRREDLDEYYPKECCDYWKAKYDRLVTNVKRSREQVRKETAKEILKSLYNYPHEYHEKKIIELAKKYGVEVEE